MKHLTEKTTYLRKCFTNKSENNGLENHNIGFVVVIVFDDNSYSSPKKGHERKSSKYQNPESNSETI